MIGSHTAVTFSMRSHAAWAAADHAVNPTTNATNRYGFIQFLRMRLRPGRSSSAGPMDEQLFDDEKQQVDAVAHGAGDENRAVHVGELIRDLGVDDAMTETVDRADEHLGDDDHDQGDRYGGAKADEGL